MARTKLCIPKKSNEWKITLVRFILKICFSQSYFITRRG
uniref:Uncharacterized protein n=1 Tax=Siphoviridae sp. ctINK4 TaxID=2825428 RepID=A0A8S5NWM8_9CAUD|nr:MAG TPA: hypothetical protein [Siphoviridae sp. ctINK4]